MKPIVKLFLLSSLLLFAEEKLFQHLYWHKLLHVKNGASQIDDPHFFLSKNGKLSPKEELEATLKSLKESDHTDINGTQCRYPARTRWLKTNLPQQEIKECKYLSAHLQKFDFKTLYVVYTSSFMNAPASMVGHTFLRFDKDENTPLLSYALNYSAQIKDNPNILSYAYNGLFGGFKGRYSIIPYYEMVKLYSDMEHRDMWEYKLDLTPEEIERVVLHMFEIKAFYSDYFFTSENCSYNLLWFIELAKENLKLVDKFDHITAPMDTIKELERQHLIKESIFRASKTTKIKNIYAKIREKEMAKIFLKEGNLTDIQTLPTSEQTDILSLYFLKNNQKDITKLLTYRSQLGIKKSEKPIPSTNPIHANKSTKLTLSYRNHQPEFGIRFAYHDIHDVDYDFNEGSYISFFDIQATPHQLNAIKLIDINSLTKPHPLYNPYSWGLSFGFDREKRDRLTANLKLKGGKSFDLFDALLFVQPTLEIGYPNKAHSYKIHLNLGYEVGLIKSFRDFKMGLLATPYQKEGFFTYQFVDDMALHLSIIEKERERVGGVRVFFYF
jgi:hypothetical protein